MYAQASAALSRRVAAALLLPATGGLVAVGGDHPQHDVGVGGPRVFGGVSRCEASSSSPSRDRARMMASASAPAPAQDDGGPRVKTATRPCVNNGVAATSATAAAATGTGTNLRKRMTSIGRFSLRSETRMNPSLPTFFIALAGHPTDPSISSSSTKDRSVPVRLIDRERGGMSHSEFESLWEGRDVSGRHERFRSRVSRDDDRYFEPSTATFRDHVGETPHFSVYRSELKKRVEHMLTRTLDVTEQLWEAEISTGTLGSSGAVSKARVRDVQRMDPTVRDETVLLFRAHHAMADGVSLFHAISDLSDEAEELRGSVGREVEKFKTGGRKRTVLQRIRLFLRKLIGYWILGTARALAHHSYLLLVSTNPFEAIVERGLEDEHHADDVPAAEMHEMETSIRSVSWCDAAPVDDVKQIASVLMPDRKATINDVFVSCVSYAVMKQLEDHRETSVHMVMDRGESKKASSSLPKHINVVVPVHLYGGVIPPEESMGNRLGAMVVRVPGCMTADRATMAEEPFSSSSSSCTAGTDRLREVSKSLAAMKGTPAPIIGYIMAKFCSDFVPERMSKFLMREANANASVVVSNVRGPTTKLHMNGRAVEGTNGFLPLPPGVPIGVVVQSYAGMVSLSVTADRNAVPDADRFLGWVLEEYKRLCVEAMCRVETKV